MLLQAHEWEELIDEAHALLARLAPGDVQRRAFAHRLLGVGLLETDNAHEAVEVLEPAVVAMGQDDPMLAVASWTLGRALVASERPDLATPHFVTAAAGFQADQRLRDAAAAHEAAGLTLFQCGSHGRAAEHLVNAAGSPGTSATSSAWSPRCGCSPTSRACGAGSTRRSRRCARSSRRRAPYIRRTCRRPLWTRSGCAARSSTRRR